MTYLSLSILSPDISASGDQPDRDIVHVDLSGLGAVRLTIQGTLAELSEFHATLGVVLADVRDRRRDVARQVLVDDDVVDASIARLEALRATGASVVAKDDPFGEPNCDLTQAQLEEIGF